MKKSLQLKPLLLSLAVAGSAAMAVTPASVQAGEISYNAAVSNMYLWRGLQISESAGTVFGGADYSHESGLYLGTWTSSEGASGSTEFDVYGGYAPTFGDVSLNIGYAAYFYPAAGGSSYDRDDGNLISEYVLGLGYKDFSATAYINTETDDADNYKYISLDYGMGAIGLHYGTTLSDNDAAEYSDVNISYAATDNLSFKLSKAFGDAVDDTALEKPLLQLTYGFTF
ncbi:TorF family putative porin [Thiomicrorhabdus sp. 6S3-12]|uniref:TorF family putative porin n=1 Tax=Thiomicrorhabdus sp. 6S3-12 TaxID=2819681 RepID=UPI001AADC285|nr:TorF family putative porin [Thiomicrorhabdus sp. 6S3-12]MBO1923071.1 hypothetical protein [Thiomicrorhabdus sp. 6S3-12]